MIIKARSRSGGRALADYLLSEGQHAIKAHENERVEVWEAAGLEQGDTLQTILQDFEQSAGQSRCCKPLYHMQLRTTDGELLNREQWLTVVQRVEERLELTGHERVIVAHTKDGHEHLHVVWNRINYETGKAAALSFDARKRLDVARELEQELGLRRLWNGREPDGPRPDRAPETWEMQRGERSGLDPRAMKQEVTNLWRTTDSGKAFAAALVEHGYMLAQGDRRDFVMIDRAGDVHSLARRIAEVKAADLRERMHDLDRARLPTIAEAKALQQARAAIAKEPPRSDERESNRSTVKEWRQSRDEHTARRKAQTISCVSAFQVIAASGKYSGGSEAPSKPSQNRRAPAECLKVKAGTLELL